MRGRRTRLDGAPSRRDLLAIGGAAAVSACAPRGGPSGRDLTFWAMGVEGENVPRVMPPFEAASGIRVGVQAQPWTAAHEKLLTGYAGGSLPDVMMVVNGWVPELAMLGALAPVPPQLTRDQLPGTLGAVTIGGTARALPWVVDTLIQFYRRDLLAQAGYDAPPPDWAGWKAMAHALKRRDPERFAVLMLLDWPEHLFGYASQQPEPLLRDRDTRGNFASAGFRAALAHYKSLFDEGLAPRMVGTEIGDMFTAFTSGFIAIMPAGVDMTNDLTQRAGEIMADHWAAALMPGPSGPATGPIAGNSLAVAHDTADPARAWALVHYLCTPATQLAFHAITGGLPSRASAWAVPRFAADPVVATFASQLARGVTAPQVPEWAHIQEEVQLVAQHMVRGEYGVDAAAREMDVRVDRILAKRRWLLDRGRIA